MHLPSLSVRAAGGACSRPGRAARSEKPKVRDDLLILERAFELAQSGQCADLRQLTGQLKAEGYATVSTALRGRVMRQELRTLCESVRAGRA
jgi:hypothetical protein